MKRIGAIFARGSHERKRVEGSLELPPPPCGHPSHEGTSASTICIGAPLERGGAKRRGVFLRKTFSSQSRPKRVSHRSGESARSTRPFDGLRALSRSKGSRSWLRMHARRGFTLLELLLGTAVGAVVLVVIQTTFFGALRLHNTTHERIDEDLVIHRTLGIVQRDFAGLVLPGGTLAGHLQSTNFSAMTSGNYGERVTPDLFTSSGKVDGWTPFAEVQRVAYYLTPAANGGRSHDLVRVVSRNLLPVQEDMPAEQVLLHNVAAATVEFYDRIGWTDTWDSEATETLPSALKLSLVMASRDASQRDQAPIELIVPIVATTTTSVAEAEEEGMPLP